MADLGLALREAVLAQRFETTHDTLTGAPVDAFPSLDLALVVFAPGSSQDGPAPRCGNVLFSRERPQGHVARIAPDAGAVDDVLFLRDERDAAGTSWLWQPGARWAGHLFTPLAGRGPERFVAPYPASLLKLMVAVGVGLAVDAGRARWSAEVLAALEAMITVSSNEATDELVALLHRADGIGEEPALALGGGLCRGLGRTALLGPLLLFLQSSPQAGQLGQAAEPERLHGFHGGAAFTSGPARPATPPGRGPPPGGLAGARRSAAAPTSAAASAARRRARVLVRHWGGCGRR